MSIISLGNLLIAPIIKLLLVNIVLILDHSRYMAGGVASGFKKVERDKYETRLLHVKGRRNIRVQQTRLAWSSMNSGDVFILDKGLEIYVWNGKEAGRLEKIKGLDVARRIKDEERGGRANIEIIGRGSEAMNERKQYYLSLYHSLFLSFFLDEEDMPGEFLKMMNAICDDTSKDIKAATDDVTFERKSKDLVKLYRVSDASGSLEITETGKYPLKREMLDSNVMMM